MRDSRKHKEYYDKWITYDQERISSMASTILGFSAPFKPQQITYLYNYTNKHLQLMISRYSRGDDISELSEISINSINAFEKLADLLDQVPDSKSAFPVNLDHVHRSLWLFIFVWATHGVGDVLIRTANVINRLGSDKLSSFIFNELGIISSVDINELYCHKVHEKLIKIFSDQEPNVQLMLSYLDRWYLNYSTAYWYENHLGEDTGYFGYYCFELLMLMKVRKIDLPETIKAHLFFPSGIL